MVRLFARWFLLAFLVGSTLLGISRVAHAAVRVQWHIDVGGSAVCQNNGTYLVTFTYTSSDTGETVTWSGPNPGTFPGTATSASNTAYAIWPTGESDTKTATVELEGTCVVVTTPPTTPPPTTVPPTTPPPTTVPPTTPPPTTVPPTTPPPTTIPPTTPPKCEGHGQDRPKCQPPVVGVGNTPTAFTGASSTGPLALLAALLLLVGLALLRAARRKGIGA